MTGKGMERCHIAGAEDEGRGHKPRDADGLLESRNPVNTLPLKLPVRSTVLLTHPDLRPVEAT